MRSTFCATALSCQLMQFVSVATLNLSYCTAVPPDILPFVFVHFWFLPQTLLFMALPLLSSILMVQMLAAV